jgi:tetratricopeptide (TPR) repeat protein
MKILEQGGEVKMQRNKLISGRFSTIVSVIVVFPMMIFAGCKSDKLTKDVKVVQEEKLLMEDENSVLKMADYYRNKEKNIDKAIAILQEAIKKNENAWPELTVLSECYITKKEYVLAENALKKAMAIESNPQRISHIFRVYGTLYSEQKKFKEAFEYLNNALQYADTPSKKADAYHHLARLNYAQKNFTSALTNINKAMELAPNNIYFSEFLNEIKKEKSKNN